MTNEINVNQDVVVMPSMTVASSNPDNSPDQDNAFWRGCVIYLNISQSSGTGGLTLNLQFKDPASGLYITVFNTAARTAVGLYIFGAYPSYNIQDNSNNLALPRTWRVQITKGDASSYTYSVGASMLK